MMGNKKILIGQFCAAGKTITYMHKFSSYQTIELVQQNGSNTLKKKKKNNSIINTLVWYEKKCNLYFNTKM